MRPDDKSGDAPDKGTLIIRHKRNADGKYSAAIEVKVSMFLFALGLMAVLECQNLRRAERRASFRFN
jgi:hypothetical protein